MRRALSIIPVMAFAAWPDRMARETSPRPGPETSKLKAAMRLKRELREATAEERGESKDRRGTER